MKRGLLSVLILFGAVVGSAAAIEAPQPKPGWWERSGTGDGKTGAMRTCITAAMAAQSKQMNDDYNKKNCSKNETRQEGGKWITDRVCKVGGSTMTGHSVIVFDGDNAYHQEGTVTYNPPFNGQSRTSLSMDAKWLGTCQAGRMPEVVK